MESNVYDEYVYLSDDKVAQFIPRDVRWWSKIRAKKFTGKAGIGGFEASAEFESVDLARMGGHLDKLERHILEFSRWYEEQDLVPGNWVSFEGRIGCQVTDRDPARGAVLFCQAGSLDEPSRRIVLHGSAEHLVRATPANQTASSGLARSNPGYSRSDGLPLILEAVGDAALPDTEQTFWRTFSSPPGRSTPALDTLPQRLETLFTDIVGTETYLECAPYLGGCARVSRVVNLPTLPFDVVVASPLFVRYQRP